MGLREELLARRQATAAVAYAERATRPLPKRQEIEQPLTTFARKNVAAGGILEDEQVEVEDERIERSADAYFHAERVQEIRERVSLADATLIDGLPAEHAAYEDADVAHSLVAEAIAAYERPEVLRSKNALAWELRWDHGS